MKDGTSWAHGDTGWPLWTGSSQPHWSFGQRPVLGALLTDSEDERRVVNDI